MVNLQRLVFILALVILVIPSKAHAAGLDPAFKEINAEKILPLPMDELQPNYKKYLDEFRNYFGK